MMISYINHKEYGYINMHAEQAYMGCPVNGYSDEKDLDNLSPGVFSNELTDSTLNRFEEFISTLNNTESVKIKELILDFKYLEKIQSNMEEKLNECKNIIITLGIDLIIINANRKISGAFDEINGCYDFLDNRYTILGYTLNDINTLKMKIQSNKNNYNENVDLLFKEILNSTIMSCCIDDEAVLESSPIITTKYINVKQCIEKVSFFPFCIYKLALNMIDKELISSNPKDNKNISLFCHTLNGAYISGLLTKLLCVDLIFFDHIGPKNKVYNSFLENRINGDKKYIVVTDVICLKSELRAVRALLDYEKANYIGTVSIVYCNTISDSDNNSNIFSLVEINKENNTLFEYYIKTDLCKESN